MCCDVYIVANCCCCSAWPASQSWQAGRYSMLPPSLAAIISRASFLETIPVQHLRKKCAMIKLSNRTKRRTPNIKKIERSCLTGLQPTSGPRNRQSKTSLTRTTPSSFITRCTLTKKILPPREAKFSDSYQPSEQQKQGELLFVGTGAIALGYAAFRFLWTFHYHTFIATRDGQQTRKAYYSPRGYWKGIAAIKKLSEAAKVSEDNAKKWLLKIYLPAPRRIPRPKFEPNANPTPPRAQSFQIRAHCCRRGQPLQRGRALDFEKFWWNHPGLSKDLQARASEMASNAADWPRARIHGRCYQRDGKPQNIYSPRAHWNSPRPGHCWTFQPHQCAAEMRLPEGQRSTAWVKRLPEVVSALNNEVTWLTGKKPAVAITEKAVAAKPSTPFSRPVGVNEKQLPPLVNVLYLYQPGELEGGAKRAKDPIWSLKVYSIEKAVRKPNEQIIYYLRDGPKHGFVREELLVIPPDTVLPPADADLMWNSIGSVCIPSGSTQLLLLISDNPSASHPETSVSCHVLAVIQRWLETLPCDIVLFLWHPLRAELLFFRPPVPRWNNTSSRAQSSCYLRTRACRAQECGRSTCPKLTTLPFLPQILFAAPDEQYPQAALQKWPCSCCPCPFGSARSLFCENTCQESHNKFQAFEAIRAGRQRFRFGTAVWLWSEAFSFPARTLARPRLDHWNRRFARLCQRPSRL